MALLIITSIAVSINIIIGLFIFKRGPQSATNRLYFALNIVIALWSAANYFSLYPAFALPQIIWIRAVLFLATPLTFLYFLFISTFPSEKVQLNRSKLATAMVLTLTVMVLALTPYIFESIGADGPVPGPLIPLFALLVTFFIAAGLYILVKKCRSAKGRERQQLLYLLYGSALMFILILTTVMIPTIVWGNTAIAPYASLYTFLFAGATGYAIVKHRLFNIQAVVARSVAYVALVSILLTIYTLAVFGISVLLFHGRINSDQVVVYSVVAIFVGATFQPLNRWLQRITEHIFFQTHYNSSDLLLRITKVLASTYSLETLSRQVLAELLNTIHISKGAVVVMIGERLEVIEEANMPDGWFDKEMITGIGAEHGVIETHNTAVKGIAREVQKSQISMAVPLYVGDAFQGVVVLGDKLSGEIYDEQDFTVLEILGREIAVAVESARNVKQIHDFNRTLQAKVDRATEELRSVNEQLERKNHQLEQLDKLKDEFISVTSHELRTPLTAIRGYLWMVMNNRKDASKREYLDRAYISTERLIDLVNDTLDISRMESGRVQLNPQPTKLPDIAKLVVQELASKAEERHQKLTVKHTSNIPAVLCDTDKIHQVFTNLIGNALKFTPEKGSISVHFYTDKDHVVTAVSDTGPGISPQDQKRLFQKFLRLEPTANQPGTGLGLYLCHRVITLSKGKIWVDSQVGEGSTFFFSLPISKDQPSILPVERKTFSGVKI